MQEQGAGAGCRSRVQEQERCGGAGVSSCSCLLPPAPLVEWFVEFSLAAQLEGDLPFCVRQIEVCDRFRNR